MMGRLLHLSGNDDDLARQLEQIWQEIPQETIRVLYHSKLCRVAACIQARCGSTPYSARYFVIINIFDTPLHPQWSCLESPCPRTSVRSLVVWIRRTEGTRSINTRDYFGYITLECLCTLPKVNEGLMAMNEAGIVVGRQSFNYCEQMDNQCVCWQNRRSSLESKESRIARKVLLHAQNEVYEEEELLYGAGITD
ncbi:uncharacterized protein TNCV_4127611 [Trichonephila clavipes]|uniref:Uncharacterized protein n=1 Tax=Trichonephila clavipes TaxID=2585209 RepID=A0A8X6VRN6_TRICX|nr:uncharacterized protein TNCV_4127611 [Trichonephila clavipes]